MDLLVATTNRGKIAEIADALSDLPVRLVPLSDLSTPPTVVEDRPDFEGNARKKAHEIALWSGMTVLADDSGLVVSALGGQPGVQSARYAGPNASDKDNRCKLLREMASIPWERRDAFFICVLAIVSPSGRETMVQGRCDGKIALEPRGEGGFGYDSIFLIPSLGKTTAELSLIEKNRISHRGRALQRLREELLPFLGSVRG